jgi:peptide/nickel transport system substrate-binding protein
VVFSPETDTDQPVGTGPFKFAEYEKGKRIVVERNPDYWGAKAAAERLEFTFYPTSAARLEALETGKIDLAFPIPPQDVARLKDAGATIQKTAVGAGLALYAATRGVPPHDLLTDVGVRKAVALSIDRKKLVSQSLAANGTNSQTHVAPAVLGSHAGEVKGIAYDPGKARELLDAAGWKPGADGIRSQGDRPLELTLVSGYPSAEVNRPVPSFLKSQLKAVGIGLEVVEAESLDDYNARLFEGRGDLFLEQGSQNDGNPAFLPLLLYNWPPRGAYHDLFTPGDAYSQALAPTLTSNDPEAIRTATAAALREAIETQAAVIPLAGLPRFYASAPGVKGFVPHPSYFNTRWDQARFAGD